MSFLKQRKRCFFFCVSDRICCGVVTLLWPMRSVKVTEVGVVGEGLGY